MKPETKDKLLEAWAYCDDKDKSTEYMLQYMQDFAGVDLDCVVAFIQRTTDKERIDYLKRNLVEPFEKSILVGGVECKVKGLRVTLNKNA